MAPYDSTARPADDLAMLWNDLTAIAGTVANSSGTMGMRELGKVLREIAPRMAVLMGVLDVHLRVTTRDSLLPPPAPPAGMPDDDVPWCTRCGRQRMRLTAGYAPCSNCLPGLYEATLKFFTPSTALNAGSPGGTGTTPLKPGSGGEGASIPHPPGGGTGASGTEPFEMLERIRQERSLAQLERIDALTAENVVLRAERDALKAQLDAMPKKGA